MTNSDVFYKACMSHPSIMIVSDPITGNIIEANQSASKAYGYTIEELKNLKVKDICNFTDKGIKDEKKVIHNDVRKVYRTTHKRKDGSFIDMMVNSFEIKTEDSNPLVMCTIHPFEKSKGLREEEISLADNSNEPFIAMDQNKNVVLVNTLFEEIFGEVANSFINKNITELFDYIECYQNEEFFNNIETGVMNSTNVKLVNKNKETVYFNMFTIPIFQSDNFFGTIITLKDTTLKTKKELMLHHLAYHDSLTNIHNRAYFVKNSDKILKVAKENNMRVGILFCDLDRLKKVNDTFGHKYGDLALQRVAKTLPSLLKDEEGLFRMGGDEFVAIITDENILSSLDKICLKIEDEICKQYIVDNNDISVGITIGYSLFPDESDNIETLLDIADRRMYARKKEKHIKRYE